MITPQAYQCASEHTMTNTTTQQERLLNAALGLCGEAAEVVRSGWGGTPIEEVGDCLWYVCQMCKALDTSIATLDVPQLDHPANQLLLVLATCDIADMVKKHVFHQRPIDRAAILHLLGSVVARLDYALLIYEVPLSAAMEHNVTKLLKRFPDGFSYAAANARADEVR